MAMASHWHKSDPDAVNGTSKVRKKLFVFFDGTWQDGVNNKTPLTNVATLARCLKPIDADGCLQLAHYSSGVGDGTTLRSRFVGAATGRGMSAKIRNAYSFLSHNYNFAERRDEIILVGFSRGAFAAQCLASFISQTGLLRKQHLYYLRGLFTLWAYQEVSGGAEKLKEECDRLKDLLLETKITACAVWDTVASLGIAPPLLPRPLSFVGKHVPNGVIHAFQALALDEPRRKFKPIVWQTKERDTDVSQCWFIGSHGDVGGNGDAALGAMTLLWMIGKLQDRVGVAFDEDEIGKHLKHRFLEWDVSLNKVLATFKEFLILSHLPHEGRPTKPAWYWRLQGWQTRSLYLQSITTGGPTRVPMDIHFTVALVVTNEDRRYKCRALKAWTPTAHPTRPERIQWRHNQGAQILDQHDLSMTGEEYRLIRKWCKKEFRDVRTDRGDFAGSRKQIEEAIEEPGSTKGLRIFAKFLEAYIDRMSQGVT